MWINLVQNPFVASFLLWPRKRWFFLAFYDIHSKFIQQSSLNIRQQWALMYTNCDHLLGVLKHIQDRFFVNETDKDPVLFLEPSLGVIFD